MKKGLLTLLTLVVTFTLSFGLFADSADAKRGGGFKSNKQSFTQQKNDAKKTDNASTSQTNQSKTNTGSTQTTKQGGLFGNGGGFVKGLLVGGLATMLFGSLFTNMGGEMLNTIVNLLLLFGIIMIIRAAWTYVRNNKRPANNGPNYNRYYDYTRREEDEKNKR